MVIGALAAQEIVKGICNQDTPVDQWYYFDALQLVDIENIYANPDDYCLPTANV